MQDVERLSAPPSVRVAVKPLEKDGSWSTLSRLRKARWTRLHTVNPTVYMIYRPTYESDPTGLPTGLHTVGQSGSVPSGLHDKMARTRDRGPTAPTLCGPPEAVKTRRLQRLRKNTRRLAEPGLQGYLQCATPPHASLGGVSARATPHRGVCARAGQPHTSPASSHLHSGEETVRCITVRDIAAFALHHGAPPSLS